MMLFPQYLVGNMDQPTPAVTEDTAELIEDSEAYMPGVDESVVTYQKSKVIFFAYFIPIIFLILGIIVFMGAVIQKFKKLDKDQMSPNLKNYGTCHDGNMRLFQHCPPSTSTRTSPSAVDVNVNEILNKELEKRLEGNGSKIVYHKSKRGKKNKKLNIVQIA